MIPSRRAMTGMTVNAKLGVVATNDRNLATSNGVQSWFLGIG
jgi:hypothetical protein